MDMHLNKTEIDFMLWEVDEHLKSRVERTEVINMYKRCTMP
jgi:hypothetical protein